MNRTEHELELMRRYLDGVASLEETQELEALIVKDASVRQDFLRYTHLDSALAGVRRSQPSVVVPRRSVWLSWRPLTAAAAGIVFGMFCTSVVFGFVGQRQAVKKTPLPMMQPGFEDARMPLVKGFPPRPSLWTGDVAKVVSAEHGITPKDGHHMLRLETSEKGAPLLFPRLYQIIALPPSTAEQREIEVNAAFAAADTNSTPHYSIRVYAVHEAPEALGADWFASRDEAIAMAATGFDKTPGSMGWQSFGLRIQVPRKARSLVVFFGVKNQAKSPAKLPHYLDAVQVSFIESSTLP
jgi:hypothetical protein